MNNIHFSYEQPKHHLRYFRGFDFLQIDGVPYFGDPDLSGTEKSLYEL